MGGTYHVRPIGDLIEHDTSTDQPDCVCGPTVEFVPGDDDGSDGWLISHNSLDGRERFE